MDAPEPSMKRLGQAGAFRHQTSDPAARKAPMPATVSHRPKVLAPRVLAPQVLAPQVLAPRVLAPKAFAPKALALGLLLPLALAGAASAQQQTGAPQTAWVDPPQRASVAAPAQDSAGRQGSQTVAKDRDDGNRDPAPVRQAAGTASRAQPKAAATRVRAPDRAAPERPPAREALRRHAHAAHRLAAVPTAPTRPMAPAVSGERAAAARTLTADYLATVSGPVDTMVGAANRLYATRVRFYGRPVTTAGLAAEKRSFVQRWPERRYEPRAMSTACDAETCTIRTLVAFRTANPGRGAVSSGEAELILEVGFAGTRPYIIGESGRVLRRSLQAGTLAPSPGKA
ncbi:hypothetical protein MMSR116_05165 [Methylobacterium mesophilicum SR1.6/6]|uniref:Uncharacterized protein n=2 Tax=Methylobacterium mesophilicum TaxID=39956 RepID=A0A6B9FXP2_9HYPH|nr:hypothetical protein MMSR116_05165 [Methylobacterium mesophilicum SR1.6/6]